MSLANHDEYEDALWNNDFYSSAAGISQLSSLNHIFNLKKTVNIPNSMLSALISAGLMGTGEASNVESSASAISRTLLMKVSPSVKALESALNDRPTSVAAPPIIEEEETSDNSPGSDNHKNLEHDAVRSTTLPEKKGHYPSLSLSTMGESGYSLTDVTPKLDQPATFQTIKCLSKDFSPHLKTVSSSFPEKEVESGETKVSTGEDASERGSTVSDDKADDTLTEAHSDVPMTLDKASETGSALVKPTQVAHTQYKSMLDVPQLEEPFQPQAKVSSDMSGPKPLAKNALSESLKKATTKNSMSEKLIKSSKATSTTPLSSKSQMTPRSQMSRSPHQKSLSEFHESPASATHRRSNTVSDISALANGSLKSLKRFSFRGLFKIKSKNHSLDKLRGVEEEPSKPVKITAKSYSTPNFSQLVEEAPKSKDARKSFFGMKKKSTPAFLATKLEAAPASVQQEEKQVPKAVKPKAAVPPALGKPKEAPQTPVPRTPQTFESSATMESGGTPATIALNGENTIREVDDSDYYPRGFPDVSEITIDEENLDLDPPKRLENRKYGEEVSLEPFDSYSPKIQAPLDPKQNNNIFGSPFALSYHSQASSPHETPKISVMPVFDHSKNSLKESKAQMNVSELLVGEALFPKSLLPHEVESIVSLERSRSMKSVRSGKRSSFMNYDGSDENIIFADSSSQNVSGMKRSGSILKKSHSTSSVMSPLIDASLEAAAVLSEAQNAEAAEATEEAHTLAPPQLPAAPASDDFFENYEDLIEFTDFIDIDNLDFSSSPLQSSAIDESGDDQERDAVHAHMLDQAHAAQSAQVIDTVENLEFASDANGVENGKDVQSIQVPPPNETNEANRASMRQEEPTIIVVDSASGLEPQTPPPQPVDDANTPNSIIKSPILDTAYRMAVNEAVARESPSTAARPISMSFRGFSGLALKNQQLHQSGSHQLFHLADSRLSDSLAVGEGFGSSDDEDDDEYDDENAYDVRPPSRDSKQGLGSSGSSANRAAQTSSKYGDLQPPQAMPFHHDRIPSVSDHSTTSSPRLFSSFISRIRKSPMALPRPTFGKKGVRFSSRIILYDTFDGEEYDRHPDVATCNQLTPMLAQQIKDELNEFKSAMVIHKDSQCNTHFF